MKTKFLIIILIIVGFAISLPFLLESSRSLYPESYENTFRYEIETDFLNKIRETGDNSDSMTFVVISKQDLFNRHENYCGFAHMKTEQYWYFADTLNDVLLSSNVAQDVTPWCEDDDSCYCELREFIGVDRRSYEDFFRMHVSETCPVISMPENATSFDPTKCEWIENKSTECDEGFKAVDGVCKQLGKIREKDIPVFFEIQLMELGIEWELADRSWANPDFEPELPARICSHIIKDNGAELYISTILENEYSLSDMVIQREMPDDCVKFFPVTEISKNSNYNVPIIPDIGKTGTYKLVFDDKEFDIAYSIKGTSIEDMIFRNDFNSLFLTLDVVHQGSLDITIPRDLLDAKFDYCEPIHENPPDDQFFVLLDGEEILYDEILTTSENRTLQITFDAESEKIEIIEACLV